MVPQLLIYYTVIPYILYTYRLFESITWMDVGFVHAHKHVYVVQNYHNGAIISRTGTRR